MIDYVARDVTKWKSEEIVNLLLRYLYPKRSGSCGCDPTNLKSQTSLKDNVAKTTLQLLCGCMQKCNRRI